ncbi:lysophospholipid acyltransferase family protein [Edaphobacter modestus]|uniref:1-acyl-sn-glycerol-3-phosphate acyltransferase n=1 Tax=Edaphobacter modestus TaxID=388466 RepID=A0A4Q7YZJ1_9BACT|nr:lysophospholipid acyltransferase family protein [Edaphobacter modestus]RZU43347.1 1-acyl-sn-glycerol-3-phosphate acyltransferase [Edaphobacter modestus]
MSFFRSVTRSIHLAGHFVRFGAELLIRRPSTREARAEWLHRFASIALERLGIEIEVSGGFPTQGAVISNHLSYLDIIVFAALRPCVFVSKVEVADYPVLGWMTTMAGTVYVARGYGGSALKARADLEAVLHAGLPVVFFPEGTTTNGDGMLKFHSGLLAQVRATGGSVTAAHLCYRLGEGNGDATVGDDVCYWGDHVVLMPHIFRLLGLRGIRAEVRFAAEPIAFSSELENRKRTAQEAWVAVAELGQVQTSTETVHYF